MNVTYHGRMMIQAGRFPVTFTRGKTDNDLGTFQVWDGHRIVGRMPTYTEARERVRELEDKWIAQLKG